MHGRTMHYITTGAGSKTSQVRTALGAVQPPFCKRDHVRGTSSRRPASSSMRVRASFVSRPTMSTWWSPSTTTRGGNFRAAS
eukprot:scaffold555_cov292-Prasinococcus_capsulatus_cf.AAC.1